MWPVTRSKCSPLLLLLCVSQHLFICKQNTLKFRVSMTFLRSSDNQNKETADNILVWFPFPKEHGRPDMPLKGKQEKVSGDGGPTKRS